MTSGTCSLMPYTRNQGKGRKVGHQRSYLVNCEGKQTSSRLLHQAVKAVFACPDETICEEIFRVMSD